MSLATSRRREELVARSAEVADRRYEMTPVYGFDQREVELKVACYVSPEAKGA
jgi:hypothetical protein